MFTLKFFFKAGLFPLKYMDESYINSLPDPWSHLSAASLIPSTSAALLQGWAPFVDIPGQQALEAVRTWGPLLGSQGFWKRNLP